MTSMTWVRIAALHFRWFLGQVTISCQCFGRNIYALHCSNLLSFAACFGALLIIILLECAFLLHTFSTKLKHFCNLKSITQSFTVFQGPCFHARHFGRIHGCTLVGFWSRSQSEFSGQITSRIWMALPQVAEH